MNTVKNGKGDSDRVKNFKSFSENFDFIEWRKVGTFCYYCGQNITPETLENYKDSFIFHNDGNIEHKKCKFM